MSLFRVFVDGQLFYHPHLSQLSITEAKVQEDAENIELSARRMLLRYLRGGPWMMGQIFIIRTHGHASPALRI